MSNFPGATRRGSAGCLKWIMLGVVICVVATGVGVFVIINVLRSAFGGSFNGFGLISINYPQGYPNAAAMSTLLPQLQASPFDPTTGYAITAPVQGDPAHFDPIQALSSVTAFSGEGSQLISFEADYVRSDGTMDLTATNYSPTVTYKFARKVPTPTDAPPVGAGGTLNGFWYEPVEIDVYQPGRVMDVSSSNTHYSYSNQGMDRSADKPTSDSVEIAPQATCSTVNLWKVALTKDAPKGAVAIINYDHSGYRFDIPDANVHLQFDTACNLSSSD